MSLSLPDNPDLPLENALKISQHALMLAAICLLEDGELVSSAVLNNNQHPDQPRQQRLVIGMVDQLLRFCDRGGSVDLSADFVRHEIRLASYQLRHPF